MDPSSRPAASATRAGTPFHIPSLDGLRAVSFFVVFVAHAGLDKIVPGGFGVTVFFFLSGYLITTLMRIEHEKTRHVNLGHFYLRRALRILPPFYIVLVAATCLAALGWLGADVRLMAAPVASQALHFSNYWMAFHGADGIAPGTGVYWSLAVEEHFYLLFPAVFLVMSRLNVSNRTKAFWFWGTCAIVLAWRCALVLLLHARPDRTYLCSDTRLDSIAFGCALGVWQNPILDTASGWLVARWGRGFLLAGFALLLLTFLVRGSAFRETFRYTLQGLALTPIFIMAVRSPDWFIFRPLNWRPMRFVGTLSYVLYLVHQVVLEALERDFGLGGVLRAALALGLSLLVAWVLHVSVERPCARLRRQLSSAGSP